MIKCNMRSTSPLRSSLKGRVYGVPWLSADASLRNATAASFDTISNAVNTSSLATRFARRSRRRGRANPDVRSDARRR